MNVNTCIDTPLDDLLFELGTAIGTAERRAAPVTPTEAIAHAKEWLNDTVKAMRGNLCIAPIKRLSEDAEKAGLILEVAKVINEHAASLLGSPPLEPLLIGALIVRCGLLTLCDGHWRE